jgi:hypothetical protein
MTDDKKENSEKEVQFYAQTIAAWFNTRLEHDKSLLTLSAGGIALLITLLTTVGVKSVEGLVLYILSIISFIACLISVLFIFSRNASYLESVIKSNTPTDPILKTLDRIAILCFLLGVIMASILGVSVATTSFIKKEEVKMSSESKNKKVEIVKESFNGANNLRPQSPEVIKSFNGITNLRPNAQQESQSGQDNSSNQGDTTNKK